jgi:3',5'-cyclic AMP phosphodiesterase CpdA
MPSITWLHITDLHFNTDPTAPIAAQRWLWPDVREEFFKDLRSVYRHTGAWDLVFFTGDLAQSGTVEDYRALDEALARLWAEFRLYGSDPVLLPIPGNHDVKWPDPNSGTVRALQHWATDEGLRNFFWANDRNEYRRLIRNVFAAYTEWWGRRRALPNAIPTRPGLLPGDYSASYEKDGLKLGIVGLNSAFLQLGKGVREGELLDLDPRQLHEVCEHDPVDWTKKHDINLLMTHHPRQWLNPEAQRQFVQELARGDRFLVHLFGHMHEPIIQITQWGGGAVRRELQGASLFGLDTWETPEGTRKKRIHGYSAGRFEVEDGQGTIRIWPRKLIRGGNGEPRMVADQEQLLDDQESIAYPFG